MAAVTFKSALRGNSDFFTETVDASTTLLNKLRDRGIIQQEHVEKIQGLVTSNDKAIGLYDILLRCDEERFDDFCEALIQTGQPHVVRKLLSPRDPLTSLLRKSVEPDYGFPRHLYFNRIINEDELDEIKQSDGLGKKVDKLLNITRKSWNFDGFHDALKESDQSHVSNCIIHNGENKADCDNWPLTENHRRLLNFPDLVKDLALKKEFLELLVKCECLSEVQTTDVQDRGDNEQGREYLLRLMERRSIANYGWFMTCVKITQRPKLVKQLDEIKALAVVTTKMMETVTAKMSDRIEDEADVQSSWIVRKASAMWDRIVTLVYLRRSNSLDWYFNCTTVDSLKHLRGLYQSGELLTCLQQLLTDMFVEIHGHGEVVSMSVTWSDEDYQDCLQYLTSSQRDELQADLLVNLPVEVMEVLLAKAAVLLFKNECTNTRDAVGALQIILTVCRLWFLMLSREHVVGRVRLLWRTACRNALTLQFECSLEFPKLDRAWGDVCIAVLDDSLFIARRMRHTINVCNLTSSELIQTIEVRDYVLDVVACSVTQRVYLATAFHRHVLLFEWKSSSQSTTSPLNAYDFIKCDRYEPYSLSVTRRQQLLVAGEDYEQPHTMVLYLYSENGELVQRVQLPDNGVESLLRWDLCRAVQNANDNFIVCRCFRTEDVMVAEVAEYDSNGLLVRSFDNSGRLFEQPCYLMLDLDGHVLVADRGINSVVLLNSSLELVRVSLSQDQLMGRQPVQLCYRPQARHLFVALSNGNVNVYSVVNWFSLTTRRGQMYSEQMQSMTGKRPVRSFSSRGSGRLNTSREIVPLLHVKSRAPRGDAISDISSSHSGSSTSGSSGYVSSHSNSSRSRSRVWLLRPIYGSFSASTGEEPFYSKAALSDTKSDYSSSHSTKTVQSTEEQKSSQVTATANPEEHFQAEAADEMDFIDT